MALSTFQPWMYFHASSQSTALANLRALLGPLYSSSPPDDRLLTMLAQAVDLFHGATGRFFLKRTGVLDLNGQNLQRLELPVPVITTAQGGTGVTAITIWESSSEIAVDLDDVRVNAGVGFGVDDPRNDPYIIWDVRDGSILNALYRPGKWPKGVLNVHVTASWGYVEESGGTPALVLQAIARLVEMQTPYAGDADGQEDRKRAYLMQEQTHGRSYMLAQVGLSGGLTGDRIVDQAITRYRRPPFVGVARVDERVLAYV